MTHESVRQWCRKFGARYARRLRRTQGRLGDVWFLDEISRTTSLPLARRRPRRRHDRHLGPAPAQPASGQALLSQAVERAGKCAHAIGYKQAGELQSSASRADALGSPRDAPLRQQPSRGVAPTDSTTGATDEAVQVGGACAAISARPGCCPQSVSSRPSSSELSPSPYLARPRLQCLERGDLCLKEAGERLRFSPLLRPRENKLTMPFGGDG